MIFYFSATGNTKYVAERISKEIGEKVVSIAECFENNKFSFEIKDKEAIGFITPTYFWGLPSIVREFLDKVELKNLGESYVFHIATFGTTTGQISNMMKNYLEQKGVILNTTFSIKMVDTWTPVFDLTDKNKISRINEGVEHQIDNICKEIKNKSVGDYSKNKVLKFAVNIYYPLYEKKRKTSNFTVEESCIGCKICEKKCPVKAIEIQDGKPVWVKDECTLCLGCLHRCPKFAIQYGKNTKKHGQFTNPNVKI